MDEALLEKLICLSCSKSNLKQEDDGLVCLNCGQNVSLNNGIPNFLSSLEVEKLRWKNIDPDDYELSITHITQVRSDRLPRIDKPLLKYVQGDVLEVGCGTCRLATPVEKSGGRYFGLDPMLPYLLYARDYRNLNRLVCGLGEKLPFQDKSFDNIISGFYAYRYVNPELGLPEARRILKTGGKFVFDLLNYWILKIIEFKNYLNNRSWEGLRYFYLQPRFNDTFEFINLSQLKQKAKESGFLVEDIISTPIIPLPLLSKYFSKFYYRDRRLIYLGYDVIIVLKAI